MTAAELRDALAGAGFAADVEGRDRLAVVRAADAAAAHAIAARRRDVMALATAHGFTHVALEVAPARPATPALESDAALPGD